MSYPCFGIKKIFDSTVEEIKKIKPSKVILIDYPGFNLRLAKKLSALNFDVTYFILPQVWAWKESRTKILQQCCKKLISIIPFEKNWFSQKNASTSALARCFLIFYRTSRTNCVLFDRFLVISDFFFAALSRNGHFHF